MSLQFIPIPTGSLATSAWANMVQNNLATRVISLQAGPNALSGSINVAGSGTVSVSGSGQIMTVSGSTGVNVRTGSYAATFSEAGLNFVNGGNMVIQMVDNPSNQEVQIILQSTATGSGTGSGVIFSNSVSGSSQYNMAPYGGISANASRADHNHGTPPLSNTNPASVSSTPNPGIASLPSPSDHQHVGVAGIGLAGGPILVGNVALATGSNIILSQSGQSITVASTASGVTINLGNQTPSPVGVNGYSGSSLSGSRADHVHQGVTNITSSGSTISTMYGGITLSGSGKVTLINTGNTITISGSGDCPIAVSGTIVFPSGSTVETILLTFSPSQILRIYNFYFDFINLTQPGILRVYNMIDGSNYRLMPGLSLVLSGSNLAGWVMHDLFVNTNTQITWQATQAESTNINIPYRYFYEGSY
jgi:hypothetical protein